MSYWEHVGKPGAAEQALQEVLDGTKNPGDVFTKVSESPEPRAIMEAGAEYRTATTDRPIEPSETLSGEEHAQQRNGSIRDTRRLGQARKKPDEKTGTAPSARSTSTETKAKAAIKMIMAERNGQNTMVTLEARGNPGEPADPR